MASWTCVGTTDFSLPFKNNRQNEPAGQIYFPTWVEVCVMGSRTRVGTTDVSPPVINNTDRMKWLIG